jgi:hypothetical protein
MPCFSTAVIEEEAGLKDQMKQASNDCDWQEVGCLSSSIPVEAFAAESCSISGEFEREVDAKWSSWEARTY